MDSVTDRTVDQIILKALGRSAGHLSDADMVYTNFCLGLKSITPANQLERVVEVLAEFRASNARSKLGLGEAEAEIRQKMQQQVNYKRGLNSVKKGFESIGVTLTDAEIKVLRANVPKLLSEGFQAVTLKEKWNLAELKADEAEGITFDKITDSYQISPGQWSKKSYEFNKLPRNSGLDNSYLAKKGLDTIAGKAFCSDDKVIVPLQSAFSDGDLRSWQIINEKGKRFEKGIPTGSLFYPVGDLQNAEIVLICEGFATAETLYQATNIPTVAAMSCSNILTTIAGLSHWESYGVTKFLICADGLTDKKMIEICQIAKAGTEESPIDEQVEVRFITPREVDNYDFNDLYCDSGTEAVKAAVDAGLKLFDAPLPEIEKPTTGAGLLMTDMAVTDRIAEQLKGKVIRLRDKGVWLWFDEGLTRWSEQAGETKVTEYYKQIVRKELTEASKVQGASEYKKAVTSALSLQGARKIKDVLSLLEKHPEIADNWVSFDTDPKIIQTKNGFRIDLKTGKARKVKSKDKLLRCTGVNYDPEATCEEWEKFIFWALSEDIKTVAYMQRWLGYCLTGLVSEEKMHIWSGTGANGKTTLQEVVMRVLGTYAQVASSELLMVRQVGSATNDLARLKGLRSVFMSESKATDTLDEGTLKNAVSNEPILARFLYKEYMQFTPSHKLMLLTNHDPNVRGSDHGLWRRLVLVKFSQTIENIDPHFRERVLIPEASGVLNWLVKGAELYLKEGLGSCPAVEKSTLAYRDSSDVFLTWFEDRVKQPGGLLLRSDAWKDFLVWFDNEFGEQPRGLSSRLLSKWLNNRGYEQTAKKGARGYRGIELQRAVGVLVQ